jgi:hypothetical protein
LRSFCTDPLDCGAGAGAEGAAGTLGAGTLGTDGADGVDGADGPFDDDPLGAVAGCEDCREPLPPERFVRVRFLDLCLRVRVDARRLLERVDALLATSDVTPGALGPSAAEHVFASDGLLRALCALK